MPTAIPRSYTHKRDASEVLLSNWCRRGADSYAVEAGWPEQHVFYETRLGMHDPMLLCETVRQTLPLLSHGAYEVPLGHQLLWQDFAWELDADALRSDGGAVGIDLRITCTDVKRRKARASALALRLELVRDSTVLAVARTRFTIQDRTVYERLRGRYADIPGLQAVPLPSPASPERVGRSSFEDVVLSPTDSSTRWQLRVDRAHPILFDHPVDHAPGMLLLEAARQAAQAMVHPDAAVVVGMSVVFARYAEFDTTCWIESASLPDDLNGNRRVLVTGRQQDRDVFSAVVSIASVAGG
ncbi:MULTISPECIES: ScbA/BarX family gamma-butyrolactone biosynthesis protein [unclassified Streptomyces]|uniref:ScbA/BarX family gamma-butyrolactone biosynthesis protein n=1 Tax=unclassified Streptomyces TaxID=2593676 RepID=UPI003665690B